MTERYVVEERVLRSSHKSPEELDYVPGEARSFHVFDTFFERSVASFDNEEEARSECADRNARD